LSPESTLNLDMKMLEEVEDQNSKESSDSDSDSDNTSKKSATQDYEWFS